MHNYETDRRAACQPCGKNIKRDRREESGETDMEQNTVEKSVFYNYHFL